MKKFFSRLYSYLIRIDDPKIYNANYPFKLLLKIILRSLNIIRWIIAYRIVGKVDSISEFYSEIHIFWYRGNEGHTQQSIEQTYFLSKISQKKENIFEIGFNGGHSAETFLKNNISTKVLSCDIGWHYYSKFGEFYLKKKFGNRFQMIIEDSKTLVPKLSENTNKKFDLIYIDGGHEYKDARDDILKSKELAHDKSILVVDDVVERNMQHLDHSNSGPTKAWKEFLENGFVSALEYLEFTDNNIYRSAVVGRYN